MRGVFLRAGAPVFALVASTALTRPATGQTAPPVNHNVDGNGVDVVLGTFELAQTLVSIGPEWPHGLQYVRMRNGAQWTDNFAGGIYQAFNQLFVSVGATSAKFIYSGGNSLFTPGSFTPALADGSTLTRSGGVFTYTSSNGDIARFTAEIGTTGRIVIGTGRMMDIRYRSGALVTLNYRIDQVCGDPGVNCTSQFRIQSVTNNFNYQLHLGYAENGAASETNLPDWRHMISVRAINTAVEACDPYADQCTLAGAWPAASITSGDGYETVMLPDGKVWRFAADGAGLTAIRRPGSTSDDVTISYNDPPDTVTVTGMTGTWTYAFAGSGAARTATVQGPLGGSRFVTSDSDRQIVLTERDALGRTTSYQYDGNDRVTRMTAPEGNYVQFTYDARGNVTESRAVAKMGSGLADIVRTAVYPSSCTNQVTCNQPSSVTDARGNTTDLTYDSVHGGLLTATAPAPTAGAVRPQARYGYTSATVGGQIVRLPSGVSSCQTLASCAGAADEAVTTITYTGANFLPTGVTSANGNGSLTATTGFAYDDLGNRPTVDGPLPGAADTTRFRYNALRQVVGVVGPDPDGANALKHRAQRITYDDAGLQTALEVGTVDSQSDAHWAAMTVLQRAETDRDALGRPIAERLIAGGATHALGQTSYDARGRIDCVAQRMNPAAFGPPLPAACTPGAEGGFGPDRIVRTTYDAADQVTQVRTGYGTAQQANEASTTYTANGRTETLTDANGNRTTYVYDAHDRLSRTRMPDPATPGTSSISDFEQLSYDANGNVTARQMRDTQTIAFTYDALDRRSRPRPARGCCDRSSSIISTTISAARPRPRTRSPISSTTATTPSAGSRSRRLRPASAAWSPTKQAG